MRHRARVLSFYAVVLGTIFGGAFLLNRHLIKQNYLEGYKEGYEKGQEDNLWDKLNYILIPDGDGAWVLKGDTVSRVDVDFDEPIRPSIWQHNDDGTDFEIKDTSWWYTDSLEISTGEPGINIQTHGKNSPAIYNPEGPVELNYGTINK